MTIPVYGDPNKFIDIRSAELFREQALLSFQIESIYVDFDKKIDDAVEQHLEFSLKLQFFELYYFVFYQELLVLSQFEEPHKSLLRSIDAANEDLKRQDELIGREKHKFKAYLADTAPVDSHGKIIDLELLFKTTGLCKFYEDSLKS